MATGAWDCRYLTTTVEDKEETNAPVLSAQRALSLPYEVQGLKPRNGTSHFQGGSSNTN